jgi:hypothetical protein
MSSHDQDGNPTNEAFIKWRNGKGFTSKTRDEIIDIGINALIKESNHLPWNLIEPTDVEVVNWMHNNKNTLSTIYNTWALDNFTIILDNEIKYLDAVDRGDITPDRNKRLFTKNDAVDMLSILEANYDVTPPPHLLSPPPPPNLLKLFNYGPPANGPLTRGGYRRRNKRSKKQSKKSKKSRRSKKSKKSRKSKTSRRR